MACGVVVGTPREDVITHLVGKVNQVELLEVKILLGDGSGSLIIIVIFSAGDGDMFALQDELIGSTDIFVEAVRREFDKIEELPGVELTPGRHREAFFAEHVFETFGSSKNPLRTELMRFKAAGTFGCDLVKSTDGHFGFVLVTEAVEEVDHGGVNGVIRIDKSDPFASGKLEASVTRH